MSFYARLKAIAANLFRAKDIQRATGLSREALESAKSSIDMFCFQRNFFET
jgi:hypothetical protein